MACRRAPVALLLLASACTALRLLPAPCTRARSIHLSADTLDDGALDGVRTLAAEEAADLGLEIESVEFNGGKLSVAARGGGADELQTLNTRLSELCNDPNGALAALSPSVLEVSSPGVSDELMSLSDAEFEVWKSFDVTVRTSEPFKKRTEFTGTLAGRDDGFVLVNQRGQIKRIPRAIVASVRLSRARHEPGDDG